KKTFSPLSTQSPQRKTVNYSICYLSVLSDLCGKILLFTNSSNFIVKYLIFFPILDKEGVELPDKTIL
ncbi:MAG: hypothetical protein Q8O60_09630, partial [Deltaproteobacteria bacterium]|nr:hypothetical protein [Deltaproteobacteria bacterium]